METIIAASIVCALAPFALAYIGFNIDKNDPLNQPIRTFLVITSLFLLSHSYQTVRSVSLNEGLYETTATTGHAINSTAANMGTGTTALMWVGLVTLAFFVIKFIYNALKVDQEDGSDPNSI